MLGHPIRLADWLQVIRPAFDEPEGFRVTLEEARAHWPLDDTQLSGLLDALVQVGYLRRSPAGRYHRRIEPPAA